MKARIRVLDPLAVAVVACFWTLFAGLSLTVLSSSAFAAEIKDDTGALVRIPDHPARIVTLAPSVAELAAEILGMDLEKVVGVSESTDYPPALHKIQSIGPYQRFSLEKVVALKPDLVLATTEGNAKDQVLHLRELGVPVFVFNTSDFSKVESGIRKMGEILGEGEKGSRVADTFHSRLQAIEARGKKHAVSPRHVLIQLDGNPLVVAGGSSFLNEELLAIGAENVYGDLKSGYPRPSMEDALKRNPDTILVMAFGADLRPFDQMASRWAQYPTLSAAHDKRIKVVYAETLLQPSMRLIEGLGVLETVIYGKK